MDAKIAALFQTLKYGSFEEKLEAITSLRNVSPEHLDGIRPVLLPMLQNDESQAYRAAETLLALGDRSSPILNFHLKWLRHACREVHRVYPVDLSLRVRALSFFDSSSPERTQVVEALEHAYESFASRPDLRAPVITALAVLGPESSRERIEYLAARSGWIPEEYRLLHFSAQIGLKSFGRGTYDEIATTASRLVKEQKTADEAAKDAAEREAERGPLDRLVRKLFTK
ncbi:MAG TPA: hypothetical protein VG649_08815 [Candidatus Angelobacter sp.]|jgi:hypothetical protein|nr:hypothetical protein [Candidatus Angelobacter sp.]